jgi:hypothetical protein
MNGRGMECREFVGMDIVNPLGYGHEYVMCKLVSSHLPAQSKLVLSQSRALQCE